MRCRLAIPDPPLITHTYIRIWPLSRTRTAMHALGIATTRALALVSLPEVAVQRERTERACVLARVAASFVRIGSFEALSPPANVAFVGGGQQDAHWDALRVLGEWVGRRVLRLEGVRWRGDGDENGDGDAWGRALVVEVARRNGRMVAGWQAYGFMHGVINSDKCVCTCPLLALPCLADGDVRVL